MSAIDDELRQDEGELENLHALISQVEVAMATSTPASRSILERALAGAKNRVATLDKKIETQRQEQAAHAQEEIAIALAVQKETALNAEERETYSSFLAKDFFTKKDFGPLEQFYEKSWDRLSEDGKDRMSYRVWEGIRRDEYTFSELPKSVREKETDRAYKRLTGSSIELETVTGIPEQDRRDFLRTYDSGDRDNACKILERNCFKENMFRGQDSAANVHSEVSLGRQTEKTNVAAKLETPKVKEEPSTTPSTAKGADRDLAALDLGGVKMAETDIQGTSSEIPNGKTTGPAQRQSTRGG